MMLSPLVDSTYDKRSPWLFKGFSLKEGLFSRIFKRGPRRSSDEKPSNDSKGSKLHHGLRQQYEISSESTCDSRSQCYTGVSPIAGGISRSKSSVDVASTCSTHSPVFQKKAVCSPLSTFHSHSNSSFEDAFCTHAEEKDLGSFYDTSLMNSKENLPRFSWPLARHLLRDYVHFASSFSLCGVPYSSWTLRQIPTLGASLSSGRVQKLYKGIIKKADGTEIKTFIKKIPYSLWKLQLEFMDAYEGEYVTDGENFIMEAAALAYLTGTAGVALAPPLIAVLEEHVDAFTTHEGKRQPTKHFYVSIVTGLYGMDLLDYVRNLQQQGTVLSMDAKRSLQRKVFRMLLELHSLNLSHLDISPENVLIGDEGVKLCDFSKATPLRSSNRRHLKNYANCSLDYKFESCEPTVGKGPYLPPECWNVMSLQEHHKIRAPLRDLSALFTPEKREPYYFCVEEADVFMLGVLLFWIWSNGSTWLQSNPQIDLTFRRLMLYGLKNDSPSEFSSWPNNLCDMLERMLCCQPSGRGSLVELVDHMWWGGAMQ